MSRKNRRLLVALLVISLCANTSFQVFATQAESENTNHKMDSINQYSCYSEYNYIGSSIQEISYIQIDDIQFTSKRLIDEDGSFVMEISDGVTNNVVYGQNDFQMFKSITDEYILRNNSVMLLGSDLTGSQYKHNYLGSSGTKVIDSAQISKIANATAAYSLLASIFSLPAAVLTGAASLLLSEIDRNSPDKVVITSYTYEIVTSYDNTYLFHCYHQTIKSYDSGGHYLGSKTDYIQVIGG